MLPGGWRRLFRAGRSQVRHRGRWLRDGRGFGGGGTCARRWHSGRGLGGIVLAEEEEEAPGGTGTWYPPLAWGPGERRGRHCRGSSRARCPHAFRPPLALAQVLPRHCRAPALHSSAQVPGLCPGAAPRAGHGGSGFARSPLSCPCIFLPLPCALRARRAFPPGAEDRDRTGRPCLCLVSPRHVPVCRQVVLPRAGPWLRGASSLSEI